MAIIQKIRDKYAKVAGGVIVLALVGFVLMDATSGGRGGGLFGPSSTVAKIDGNKIDVTDYDKAVSAQEEQMRAQNRPMDENATAQLRDQVLNQMVMDKLTGELNEKLGISVSDVELKEMLNPANPDPMVRQAFTNPQTGEFMGDRIAQYERTKDAKMKAEWESFKNALIASKIQAKLNSLLTGSLYTPKFVLDDLNDGRANAANISFVNLPYTLISDDKVKVTDEDINKYVAANKKMFEVKEPNRSIDYIAFDIKPSAEDSNRVRTQLEELKEKMATTTDIDNFVKVNSSVPVPVAYQSEEAINQMPVADMIKTAAIDAIVGPFAYGQDMALAKVMERATLPDTVKVRHILIATKQGGQNVRTDAQAQARVDSMLALEKSGVPFDSLIKTFSDDNIAQNPTGEYELPLSQRSGFTKEFGDFAFSGAGAGSSKVVKVESTNYSGLHYIQIIKKSDKNVNSTKIAYVIKPIVIDNSTYNKAYAAASAFATKVANAPANFAKEAAASGLVVQSAQGLNRNSSLVQGVGASGELVKWAYEAKAGAASPIFNVGANKIVVAKLSEINEPGILKPAGAMKTSIENIIRQQKKAQLLIDANKQKTSLADIAAANQVEIATVDSITFSSPMIQGLGNEPKVLGYTFFKGFKEGTLSPGIAGFSGVQFITVNQRYTKPGMGRDLKMERQMSEAMLKSRAAQMILEGLRQSVKFEDLRYKLYR
ncbi:MAG: SurA N-terminal domain-containing protein [Taibaiella sp.]|nr:SurA N-terminal domain-containing protein [Taibaiella sp.]